jgi:predicted signal transduction protein with EAL and GGDEF domain
MNISRSFPGIGCLYLLVGLGFGMHMGASGDFTFAPLHAHINLVGFVLMAIFALVYRQIAGMADSALAQVRFWLYQFGTIALVVMLFLLLSGRIDEAGMFPVAPLAELCVAVAVLAFAVNFWRNGR